MKDLTQIPNFEKIKFHSTSFRVRFDAPLDEESCIEVLSAVIEKSSVKLEPVSTKDKGHPTDLAKGPGKRIYFTVKDPHELRIRCLSEVSSAEIKESIKSIFEAAFKVKRVQVSGIAWADVVHVFDTKYLGNHHAFLSKLYYRGSLLENVFSSKEIYSNDIMIGGLVSGADSRRCVISIEGATSLREIRSGEYDNDEINIFIYYAETKDISRSDIGNFMATLAIDAREYIISNLLDKVVKPLDLKMTELEGAES